MLTLSLNVGAGFLIVFGPDLLRFVLWMLGRWTPEGME